MKGQSFINSNSLKLVENTLVKCRIPLSSKIGVEFFVKSLRQMLPEVYILLRRFKIFGLFKSTYHC